MDGPLFRAIWLLLNSLARIMGVQQRSTPYSYTVWRKASWIRTQWSRQPRCVCACVRSGRQLSRPHLSIAHHGCQSIQVSFLRLGRIEYLERTGEGDRGRQQSSSGELELGCSRTRHKDWLTRLDYCKTAHRKQAPGTPSCEDAVAKCAITIVSWVGMVWLTWWVRDFYFWVVVIMSALSALSALSASSASSVSSSLVTNSNLANDKNLIVKGRVGRSISRN